MFAVVVVDVDVVGLMMTTTMTMSDNDGYLLNVFRYAYKKARTNIQKKRLFYYCCLPIPLSDDRDACFYWFVSNFHRFDCYYYYFRGESNS